MPKVVFGYFQTLSSDGMRLASLAAWYCWTATGTVTVSCWLAGTGCPVGASRPANCGCPSADPAADPAADRGCPAVAARAATTCVAAG